MRRRTAILVAFSAMFLRGMAQVERTDSVSLSSADSIPSYMVPLDKPCGIPCADAEWVYNPEYMAALQEIRLRTVWSARSVEYVTPGQAGVMAWPGGGLYAAGTMMELPGLMGLERGSLNLAQTFGPVSLTAYAAAHRIGYFGGVQTAYGFGGSIDWRIGDRWRITAFGQYVRPMHPLGPAMAGMMPTSNFGGYVSYDLSDRWGVSVGAQVTRSLVTNQWEAQPIVMPYYKVNKDVSIGIDVGGILYEVVKYYIDRRDARHHGPVMAPPKAGPPPVAPRR